MKNFFYMVILLGIIGSTSAIWYNQLEQPPHTYWTYQTEYDAVVNRSDNTIDGRRGALSIFKFNNTYMANMWVTPTLISCDPNMNPQYVYVTINGERHTAVQQCSKYFEGGYQLMNTFYPASANTMGSLLQKGNLVVDNFEFNNINFDESIAAFNGN